MTALRDPFETVHKKDIKNKAGEVVAKVDYVGWSQVADRLDDAAPGWSFAVVQLGDDWCLGRLTLGDGRVFENVGYAENADTSWKKEVLKDAVSDALKRCASLAGVARYLYDKDDPTTQAVRAPAPLARGTVAPTRPTSLPASGGEPEEPEWVRDQIEPRPEPVTGGECPMHHLAWALKPGGVSKTSGKPYGAFWACPSQDRPFCKEKPSPKWSAQQEMAS